MVATSSVAGKVRVIGSQLYVLLVEQIFYGKQSLGAHASFRPFLYERTHYTSGRTWENICSPSGYGVSSINSDGHKTHNGSCAGRLETHNLTNYKMFAQVRSDDG